MFTITTQSVNGRSDWYGATATIKGRTYISFQKTRQGAFMDVARQLMVKGFINA